MTTAEENWKRKVREKCKKLFDSALWHYPVHQFVGNIVLDTRMRII